MPDPIPTTPSQPVPDPPMGLPDVRRPRRAAAAAVTPREKPEGAPDAILIPRSYPAPKRGRDRGDMIRDEFAPVLESKIVHARHADLAHSMTFLSAEVVDGRGRGIARYFAKDHPLAGRDRYDWYARDDNIGVFYGYLNEDALADERPEDDKT
jgi:hypothetical protein